MLGFVFSMVFGHVSSIFPEVPRAAVLYHWSFYLPLHHAFAPRQRTLIERRDAALEAAHRGLLPDHLPPSAAATARWRIELPAWCADQRNQMTGPADDAELVVKMLNSGAPGVMLDLEDSMANEWSNTLLGIANILAAIRGELTYEDRKRGGTVGIEENRTLHIRIARRDHRHCAFRPARE